MGDSAIIVQSTTHWLRFLATAIPAMEVHIWTMTRKIDKTTTNSFSEKLLRAHQVANGRSVPSTMLTTSIRQLMILLLARGGCGVEPHYNCNRNEKMRQKGGTKIFTVRVLRMLNR